MEYTGKIKNLKLHINENDFSETTFNYKIITDNYFTEELPIITHIYINDCLIFEKERQQLHKILQIYHDISRCKSSIYDFCALNGDKEQQFQHTRAKNLEILTKIIGIKEQMIFDISVNVIKNKRQFINDMLNINIVSNGCVMFILETILNNFKYDRKFLEKALKMYKIEA